MDHRRLPIERKIRMKTAPPDMDWFRSRLSLARAHLDDALGAAEEAVALASVGIAHEICNAVTAELYRAQLAPGERGEIERELSSIRGGLQSFHAHRN